jgi:glucokinase
VRDGQLFFGDNSLGAEVWLLRNKLNPATCAEDGASIDGVRRIYAEHAGTSFEDTPEPKIIFDIARGHYPGDKAAALEAFHQLGEVVGDALANVLTLVDGLAVVGGGLSNAWSLFSPALFAELRADYARADGTSCPRLVQETLDLEDEDGRQRFLRSETRELKVEGSSRSVRYSPHPRLGIGRSRLGTSEAIAVGAYCYALEQLDRGAS